MKTNQLLTSSNTASNMHFTSIESPVETLIPSSSDSSRQSAVTSKAAKMCGHNPYAKTKSIFMAFDSFDCYNGSISQLPGKALEHDAKGQHTGPSSSTVSFSRGHRRSNNMDFSEVLPQLQWPPSSLQWRPSKKDVTDMNRALTAAVQR
jgi:hypothetical protein